MQFSGKKHLLAICCRFVDRDMYMRYTGMGIGHGQVGVNAEKPDLSERYEYDVEDEDDLDDEVDFEGTEDLEESEDSGAENEENEDEVIKIFDDEVDDDSDDEESLGADYYDSDVDVEGFESGGEDG